MAYGSIKVDNIIYDDSGDVTLPVSSIHSSISGILTVTGDIKTTGGDVVAEAGVFVGTLGAAATPTYTFSGDNNTGLYASAADQISITTSGTAKLTVKSDGKVGIGTTAPDYGIHLHSSSSYLKISNSGTGEGGSDGLIVGIDGTGNCDIWNYENKFTRFATNNTERMRIDNSGNVGIGGTPTAGILHTIGSGANQAIRFECTDDNHVRLELDADRSTGSVLASFEGLWNGTTVTRIQTLAGANDESDADLLFLTKGNTDGAPVERMRIDSSGEVKITNTGSSDGSTVSQLILYTDNSGTNDDFTQRIAFERANSAGMIYTAIDSIRTGTYNTDTAIKCNDGGTLGEKIRILSTGGITFNGDTATANALDDYEEGTFTPTLTDTSGVAVVSPAYSNGNYVKIGNTVTVTYYSSSLSISNSGNSTATIANMPFTCWNSTGHYPVASFTHTTCFSTSAGSAATNIQNGFMGTNTATLYATNETATNNARWSTGGYLMFSITYRTA